MEGEKDDIPIKEIINEYKVAFEKLKESNVVIERKLQEIEQDYVKIKENIDKFNNKLAVARVIDKSAVKDIDYVDQFMLKEFKPFIEFNIKIKEKLKVLEKFFEIDNESVLSEIEEKFLNLEAEIATMQESLKG